MKYAATYFHANATATHSRKPLKKALLEHSLPMDDIAAQAISIMILRFMGDLPAEAESSAGTPKLQSGVMPSLTRTLSRHNALSAEFQESLTESKHQRLVRRTLKRKTKMPELLRQAMINDEYDLKYYQEMLASVADSLDQMHFIIGHGILRASLRDEILAQICKQLTDNGNRTSQTRGWILLLHCLGCFPPSVTFENYFRCFLRSGPQLLASYAEQRLERTLKNGPRTQPPAWLELQAIRSRTPIKLNVYFMDGTVCKLQVDSASTAQEAVQQLAVHMHLKDAFGFGLVITLYDKVMSLGSGREHLMDAIASCDQFVKERGQSESDAEWRLYMRKEMFVPWYDPTQDAIATHLIYKQIMRGLQCGEYRCRTERDIAMICALAYYVEHGSELKASILPEFVQKHVPQDLLAVGDSALQSWLQMIANVFERNNYVRQVAPQLQAKEDICLFAHLTWPMHFSRFFEAVRTSGPKLLNDNLVLAVNTNGVYCLDDTEQILAACSYAEIAKIYHSCDKHTNIDELHMDTVQQENFVFKCYEAQDVAELVDYMLEQLKRRSKFGVAIKNFTAEDGTKQLSLNKGDLVELASNTKKDQDWWHGTNNGETGEFPGDVIYIIPTVTKPDAKLLQIYKDSTLLKTKVGVVKFDLSTMQRKRQHTLQRFAELHFRDAISDITTLTELREAKTDEHKELWRYARLPLKAPLLKQLQQKPKLFQQALVIHHHILKYMGDIPRGKLAVNTDLIFQPALENASLCDELYCQLMKQLTNNNVSQSEERGWDLMYLATGIICPSALVLRELNAFLRTRTHVLANECLKRIKRISSIGQRKHAPHLIEVEGIQQRCMHIYHKVYFPDDTVEAFEIESFTLGAHLIATICQRLELSTTLGYSIFLKLGEKVYSIPETEFIFDFITDLTQWLRQSMTIRQVQEAQLGDQYQLHFMKKLWLDVQPGVDTNADIIFHYPQELPKYLQAYYAIDFTLAADMAALVYIAEYGNSLIALQHLQEILPLLVPEDLVPLLKVSEWKSQILSKLRSKDYENMSNAEAKQAFLCRLAKQQFFGSTFFSIKQINDDSLPETLLIAINRNGFHIIDPSAKKELRSYTYEELNFWSSGKTHFHMRFGNMIGASKLLCSTTQGYKIDDLLTSYIKYFKDEAQKIL